ncbi:MAG: hypothetical protein ACXABV_09955 [Candidatus Thorarchaeota archaeon]|jgi:hypothetical protein
MKTRKMHLIAGFAMFVLCISLCTATSNATMEDAWSDDFDHGNITESGWSVQGFDTSTWPWTPRPGNITAEDKTMRVYSEWWSEAWRTSNVAYGSWAFDVHCVDTPNERSYIAFVSGSPVLVPEDINTMPFEYGIITVVGQYESYDSAFVLYRRPSDSPQLVPLGDYDVEEVSGWYHINITRDFDGNFKVYFNDTLGITVRDSEHTTSDLFTFTAEAGYALDNIVVVPYEPETTPPPTLIPWDPIVIGGGAAVVVIVLAIVFLRRR